MRQQIPTLRCCRCIFTRAKHDIGANRVRARAHRMRSLCGHVVGMDAHATEVVSQAGFEKGPRLLRQRGPAMRGNTNGRIYIQVGCGMGIRRSSKPGQCRTSCRVGVRSLCQISSDDMHRALWKGGRATAGTSASTRARYGALNKWSRHRQGDAPNRALCESRRAGRRTADGGRQLLSIRDCPRNSGGSSLERPAKRSRSPCRTICPAFCACRYYTRRTLFVHGLNVRFDAPCAGWSTCPADKTRSAHRFGHAAIWVVGLLAATGGVMQALLLGSPFGIGARTFRPRPPLSSKLRLNMSGKWRPSPAQLLIKRTTQPCACNAHCAHLCY